MTRIADLEPRFGQHPGRPLYLRFTCPACGPPYIIDIPVNLNGRTPADIPVWQATVPEPPEFSWDKLTVTPSIDNSPGGHGRKKSCSWHGHIVNGEIHTS